MIKKILIIDDNEQDRKIMRRFLDREGFQEILMAVTGQDGLKKAGLEKPDLIIF